VAIHAGRPCARRRRVRTFLGGWLGIGRIVVGMARQGYDLQLTRNGEEGWRATFYGAVLRGDFAPITVLDPAPRRA
jgi:hypothetical protein